ERLCINTKSNIARRGDGYALRVSVAREGGVPGVGWGEKKTGVDPDTLVTDPPSRDEIGREADAASFIRDALEDGEWHASADVKAAGIQEGHKRRTVERAALEEVGVDVKEEGYPRRSFWRLPVAPRAGGATGAMEFGATERTQLQSGVSSPQSANGATTHVHGVDGATGGAEGTEDHWRDLLVDGGADL